MLKSMDPQGTHPHEPAKGNVAIFNRSHYKYVLIQRVHKMVPDNVIENRYRLINDFESILVSNIQTGR